MSGTCVGVSLFEGLVWEFQTELYWFKCICVRCHISEEQSVLCSISSGREARCSRQQSYRISKAHTLYSEFLSTEELRGPWSSSKTGAGEVTTLILRVVRSSLISIRHGDSAAQSRVESLGLVRSKVDGL